MEEQKKRGRPAGSKNNIKDPMIAALEATKRRGRPAGTRTKRRVTVQSVKQNWEQRYQDLLLVNSAAKDEIIRLSVDLNHKEYSVTALTNRLEAAEKHINSLEQSIRAKDVRELKLYGIIEYLEDKVKNAIKSDSI